MEISNAYHLTYCTNIHPGENWKEVFQQLQQNIPAIKNKIAPDRPFGIGLRLANQASLDLMESDNLAAFQNWLQKHDCYVFTLNGFPYGQFHNKTVKDAVHLPDWTTGDRLDYTSRLFNILEQLLPEGMDGGISTSPLSYKPWFAGDQEKMEAVLNQSAKQIAKIISQLYEIYREKNKVLHLDIEPEPDGLIENTEDLTNFYIDYLLPIATEHLTRELNITRNEASEAVSRHFQVCYDICHFAVGFEKPEEVFPELQKIGINIGKIQISAALAVELEGHEKQQEAIKNQLTQFAESTYLHQVIGSDHHQNLTRYRDLPEALPHLFKDQSREWRTHFHVPVFIEDYNLLKSTQKDILNVLEILKQSKVTNHLEVETYTWDVLPEELKTDLTSSISRELEWVIDNLKTT